ncbi:MAG: hypothetical protein ACI8V2_004865 [Candidatus Latescibacterota bacterium]
MIEETMRRIEKVFASLRWVFVLALVVRLFVVMLGYDGDPQDTPEYEEIAHNLLAGRGFVASYWWYGFELKSWRAPFYPFFLASVYGVFGYEQWVVRVIQCVVGALTACFIVGIAKRLNAKMASLCGGLAVVYGPLVSVSNEIMTETWFIFWLVIGAYCLLQDKRYWLMGGGAIGCAILTRPIGGLLLVAWMICAWIRHTDWKHIVGVCSVAILVVLPWTIRNYYVHGAWPIVSTQGGFIVAHSNALDPDWKKEIGWGTTRRFLEEMPSELDRDRYWWREGLTFIVTYPKVYLRLVVERFVRLWYFFRPDYNFWWMLVLPVGCLGIWHYGRRGDYLFLTLFVGLSVLVFSCLLYGATRFRLPLEAFFLVFVGAGFLYLMDRWGGQKVMRIGGLVVGVHVLVDWQDVWLRQTLLALLSDLGMK